MDIDFSLLLLVLVAISGLIWLFDALLLAPGRRRAAETFARQQGLSRKQMREYLEAEEPRPDAPPSRTLEQAAALEREPVPVEYAKSFFPVLFAVLLIRAFLFEPFQIPTGSMIPTLNIGDFIVVNKYAYGVRLPVANTKIMDVGDPQRGDIMVFIPPHDPTYYIKRVVGLPGDHVRYDYEDKIIYINGEPAEQEYVATLRDQMPPVHLLEEELGGVEHPVYTALTPRYPGSDYWMKPEGRVIPEGHYFMMGDNRDNSDDSRRWGPVPESNIVGKAVAVWMHKEPGLNLPTFSENRILNK